MVFSCCVKGCKSANKDITFHMLPRETELFEKWLRIIDREDLLAKGSTLVRKNYRVCCKHFSEEQFFKAHHNRTNLKYDSIPDVNVKGVEEAQQYLQKQNLSDTETNGEKRIKLEDCESASNNVVYEFSDSDEHITNDDTEEMAVANDYNEEVYETLQSKYAEYGEKITKELENIDEENAKLLMRLIDKVIFNFKKVYLKNN